jgi:hypothetical protein
MFVNFHQNEPKLLGFKIMVTGSIQIIPSYSLKTYPLRNSIINRLHQIVQKLLNQISK